MKDTTDPTHERHNGPKTHTQTCTRSHTQHTHTLTRTHSQPVTQHTRHKRDPTPRSTDHNTTHERHNGPNAEKTQRTKHTKNTTHPTHTHTGTRSHTRHTHTLVQAYNSSYTIKSVAILAQVLLPRCRPDEPALWVMLLSLPPVMVVISWPTYARSDEYQKGSEATTQTRLLSATLP